LRRILNSKFKLVGKDENNNENEVTCRCSDECTDDKVYDDTTTSYDDNTTSYYDEQGVKITEFCGSVL